MEEIWRNIEGWPGYQVSNTGHIRSIKGPAPRILSNNNGQCIVSDKGNNKMLSIKLEVAKAFLDYVGGGSGVRLKDGNKQNCSVDNLIVKESLYIPGEEWRDIPGFEGIYAVSSLGRVKSLERDSEYYVKGQRRVRHYGESLMKQYEDQDGYLQCHLQDHGREVYCNVHRYVAQAFIPNPSGLPEANHIDGNKHNNVVENLEWCNTQYNVSHALETGLRGSQKGYDRTVKRVRCTDLNLEFDSILAAASYFGYSYTGLGKILKDGKKLYHGHHFEYIVDK